MRMTRFLATGGAIVVAATTASTSDAQQLGAVGGHAEFGVLPLSGEKLSVVFGLGVDIALAHAGRVYLGAGPTALIAVQTSQSGCGAHCPRGLGAIGGNVEGGLTLGPAFIGARVAALGGYSNGYPGQEGSVWIHPSIFLGWASGGLALGVYCGYLAAVVGEPSGFDPGIQFTSLF
jgi:hypothetical protein